MAIQDLSILSFLSLFGGVQALFIALYLLFKIHKHPIAANSLALILIGQFLLIWDYFSIANQLYLKVPHLSLLSYVFQFAYAPLFYFIIKSLVQVAQPFRRRDLLHFIPAALHFCYGLLSYHHLASADKIQYINQLQQQIQHLPEKVDVLYLAFNLLLSLQLIIYIVSSFRMIRQYRPSNLYVEEISPEQLKRLFFSILGVLLIILVSSLNLTYLIAQSTNYKNLRPIALILLSAYLFYVAYFVIAHQKAFEKPIKKYDSSSLNAATRTRTVDQLIQHMQDNKPYRSPQLNLKDLAQQLSVPDRQLSQAINEHYGYNFYEFLNFYRIEEVKKHLHDEQFSHYSILAIAYEAGFNSKSTFNSAFKKLTGTTPSAFRKRGTQ